MLEAHVVREAPRRGVAVVADLAVERALPGVHARVRLHVGELFVAH